MTLYYAHQYVTTQLSVAGGISDTDTLNITLQDVTGIDTTKPSIALLDYQDPLDLTKAEWITYTSINVSKVFQGVGRGAEGSIARTHSDGCSIAFPISESHINNLNDAVLALQSPDGWSAANETWTYNAPDKINVPSGAGSKYSISDSIRWKQGAGYKYGTLSAVADTLLTIIVNTDFTVATPTAITDNYYTHSATAIGLPAYYNFTPSFTNLTVGAGANTGKYKTTGRHISIFTNWTFGTGAAVNTDAKFTFPITPLNETGFFGTTTFYDNNVGLFLVGNIRSDGYIKYLAASGTNITPLYLSATTPFTWATSDLIILGLEYSF